MSDDGRLERAIKAELGYDKWSGRHPIKRNQGAWWKKYTQRILRRLRARQDREEY